MSSRDSSVPAWFEVADVAQLPSPGLLVYRQRVEDNVRRMIALAGGVQRLRPHLKTHKMPELTRLQLGLGLNKFKCATIAEAEMAARCGVPDLLLAYQPVGPNLHRFAELVRTFSGTRFSVIADDAGALRALSQAFAALAPARLPQSLDPSIQPSINPPIHLSNNPPNRHCPGLPVLLDLDIGQHRTGIAPGAEALELYRLLASLPGLTSGGLHAYDGQIHDTDLAARSAAWSAGYAPVKTLRRQLLEAGLPVPRVVAGGTPTFPFYAREPDVECSPGTCVFWDAGYASKLPDLDFLPAAVVLTRVVSKACPNRLCLDLGHKAVASEMPPPRVQFLNLPEAKAVAHSEEHLVIETPRAGEFRVGDCLYGVPWHVCPTVALHAEAIVVANGRTIGTWKVEARQRRLTI